MFDTTLLEQNSLNSSVGNQLPISNNLTASGINTSATDPFLSSTSHHELSLSSGFDLDYYINQNLDAAKANNSDAFDSTSVSTNTAVDALSTEAKDPLTGFSANDSLASNTASNAASSSTPWFTGTLRAEHFTLQSGSNYIISGNGNVDFGRGFRDQINLSGIYSNSVRFNLASSTGGGLLFNPGNGTRLLTP